MSDTDTDDSGHDPDDIGDCDFCGKWVGYGRINGLCGPCNIRSKDTDTEQ